MATSDEQPSRRRGSHFSTGGGSASRSGTSRNGASRPGSASRTGGTSRRDAGSSSSVSTTDARAPRSVLSTSRISSRTAAATRRAQGTRPHDPHRSDRKRRVPLSAIAVIAAIAVAIVFVVVWLVPQFSSDDGGDAVQLAEEGTEVTITVPDGSGAGEVAQLLYDNGLISDQSEFLSAVRRTEAESLIKSGTYRIVAGSDTTSIIDLLISGPNASTAQITVPEGYTMSQIAALCEESLGISADDFLAQATASNYVDDYAFLAEVGEDSLEGYLFPKTYDFSGADSVTADTVIRAMLDQYETEVASLDLASAAAELSERYGIDLDENDIVIMASIVEREAVTDDQRPKVASVFYNRLAAGMRLQSDATLTYSLGRSATADEINTLEDPYNTNLNDGLTPTPICSPSLASLEAAADPDDTDFYYFYITDDSEQFSETYEEHRTAYE